MKPIFSNPHDALRYHVTGAIERGEGVAIAGIPATPVVALKPQELFALARAASAEAAAKHDATLPPERSRGLDCGFAWVTIRPARGPFVKWCKANDIGRTKDYGGGGFDIWYSKLHDVATQSITTHMVAAQVFSEVLNAHGVPASTGSRLD